MQLCRRKRKKRLDTVLLVQKAFRIGNTILQKFQNALLSIYFPLRSPLALLFWQRGFLFRLKILKSRITVPSGLGKEGCK